MVLFRDTSSCHDDHLCQIIFKPHHVRLCYGPDTLLEQRERERERVKSICPSAISWREHKNPNLTACGPNEGSRHAYSLENENIVFLN